MQSIPIVFTPPCTLPSACAGCWEGHAATPTTDPTAPAPTRGLLQHDVLCLHITGRKYIVYDNLLRCGEVGMCSGLQRVSVICMIEPIRHMIEPIRHSKSEGGDLGSRSSHENA